MRFRRKEADAGVSGPEGAADEAVEAPRDAVDPVAGPFDVSQVEGDGVEHLSIQTMELIEIYRLPGCMATA